MGILPCWPSGYRLEREILFELAFQLFDFIHPVEAIGFQIEGFEIRFDEPAELVIGVIFVWIGVLVVNQSMMNTF